MKRVFSIAIMLVLVMSYQAHSDVITSFENDTLGDPGFETNIGSVIVNASTAITGGTGITDGSQAVEVDLTGQTNTYGKLFATFLFKDPAETITAIEVDAYYQAAAAPPSSGYFGVTAATFTDAGGFRQNNVTTRSDGQNSEFIDFSNSFSGPITFTYIDPDFLGDINSALNAGSFAKFEIFANKASDVEGILVVDNVRTITVPEPGFLALGSLLLVAAGIQRRRR